MSNIPHVLIVDDTVSNAYIIEAVLEDFYTIEIANSGEEALNILANSKIDLILLDILMPNMDGYETCERIKSNPTTASIPIIFLTAESSEESEEKGFKVGAVDYITKPIRPAVLHMRVKTHITLKQTQEKLQDMALRDQLTTLYNRHFIQDSGIKMYSHAQRHHENLTVTMVDIDFFKKVNDTHGHAVGDIVLKEVALLLLKSTRTEDIVARLGGEEFAVIFRKSSVEGTLVKIEELRQKIEELMPHNLRVTASFGVTALTKKTASFEELLVESDKALYQAKSSGRNRVTLYQA
jgi:diguanylate cyclase (GGDEF)-like protein